MNPALLVHIQTHLDEDLSLDALSAQASLSPAHFQRTFRGLVGERRGLTGPALDRVANGAVFTGRLALESGLIDEIGGEPEAVAWLESQDATLDGLPVRDWEVERDRPFWSRVLGGIASTGGILGEISLRAGPKLYSLGP